LIFRCRLTGTYFRKGTNMKKLLAMTFVCLVLTLAVAAMPVQAKTFRFAFQGDLQSLDPHELNEAFQNSCLSNVYEGLVRYTPNMAIEPCLAEKWEVTSPNVWRFYLRKGVKFHNGNPFTADDVVFTYQRTMSEGSDHKARVSTLKEIKKVDDYTIDVVTKAPNPILPTEWASWFIMDKEWCEKNNSTESTNIKSGKENYATRHENGTGPFKVVSHEKGVKTVFEVYKEWWDKPHHNLTKVILTPIGSDATRVAALLSGEVDMMYPVPVQDHKRVESNDGTRMLVGPELRTIFLGFDQVRDSLPCCNIKDKNPFKDVKVRKAFYHAININIIKKKIMRGLSEPSSIMISPKLFEYDISDIPRYPYDPKKAKALLAEAGYPKGFTVCMDCPNNRYVNDEQICQAAVSMLAKVGIKVKLKAQPKSLYFKKVLAYDTEFFMLGWTPSSNDSWNVLYNIMASRTKDGRGKFNLGGYSNARLDELTSKIMSETDKNKRNQMIHEAFKISHDEAGHIPLHQQALAWGVSDKVELKQRADNNLVFNFIVMK
jgi:peptide/nickel transport system substrate-binding protein